ncbi:hypothetical protein L4174_008990 [Photobacterium sp. CCB-ST2H9]|uniref:hypothetical protein n=1 Tax=Photobacterium sp. CCB-ST2H9 TaxID=2912855 RepID=UPI002004BE6B|nr:hypothetical protein [Photobacterium sp. CCB-ST2H9]UTM55992.1 hypothetical protein L4174_008990 [Photobacterium sp. CCB-ST2H9]
MNQNRQFGSRKRPEKDIWDKLQAVGGVSTAVIAAIITAVASWTIFHEQENSKKINLYTQLISEQTQAESQVRKDMFTTILNSFFGGGNEVNLNRKHENENKGKKEGKKQGDEKVCAYDRYNNQITLLDMLARNFHEAIDMKSLFIYVLLNMMNDFGDEYNIMRDGELIEKLSDCQKKILLKYHKEHQGDFFRQVTVDNKNKINSIFSNKKERLKARLISISGRVKTKQLESLSSVSYRVRFKIDLAKSCEIHPFHRVNDPHEYCDREGNVYREKPVELYFSHDGKLFKREFTISSTFHYKKWNMVKVDVGIKKDENENNSDSDGGDRFHASFWVGNFDFPLSDNTLFSKYERYSVILDSINETSAYVSLLYFPAVYGGFKERSYYQHKILNMLMNNSH